MFGTIQEIHRDLGGVYTLADSNDIDDRKKLVEETIQLIAQRISPEFQISVEMIDDDPLQISAESSSSAPKVGKIYVPSFCYFDANELPLNLSDPKNLQALSDWISDKLLLQKFNIEMIDKIRAKAFFEFIKNQEKGKKALFFTLGHELGHIYEDDSAKIFELTTTQKIINFISLGLFKLFLQKNFFHRAESQADDFACTSPLGKMMAQGGIYSFKVIRRTLRRLRKEEWRFRFMISPKGALLLPSFILGHPDETARIKKMKPFIWRH